MIGEIESEAARQGDRTASDPYRVMVVDDSAVVRGLVTRMLESDSNIKVIASVGNGQMALNSLSRHDIEVVVLDIEMPVMDGLTALPKLLSADPSLQVIMASTLTLKNADISMRALQMGAADYIPKPTTSRDLTTGVDFRRELVEKVKALGANRRRSGPRRRPVAPPPVGSVRPATAPSPTLPRPASHGPITLRPAGPDVPDVIAIGSSTGGPQALFTVLGGLRGAFRQPILITQHMPATFTTILAEHITRTAGVPCAEATDGAVIEEGRAYLAPGDFHMLVEAKGTTRVLRLSKAPPENFCRPSVDPMFRSLAQVYGRRVLAVILTGMGSDGLKGGRVLIEGGATLIAQDEATSVVWGMPGAVATAGICSAVLPLPEIAPWVKRFVARRP